MSKHLTDTMPENLSPTENSSPGGPGSPNWIVIAVIAAFGLAIAAGAVIAMTGGDDDSSEDQTELADVDNDGEGAGGAPLEQAVATVDGEPLSPFEDLPDDAVGVPAPPLSGTGMDGESVAVPEDGRPAMLVFLAHWCPHCQVELPAASEWLAETDLPDDVDVVAVATAMDPNRPNYPATDWFRAEGWEAPVLGDADNAAAEAYGLTTLPYWVVVDADGNVVERRAGEQTAADFDEMLEVAVGG